jgi:DNA-binding NtrC family response regulator
VAGSKRILIVDDEAQVLYIMSTALRMLDANLDVVIAHSGRQALKEIGDGPFDLIITDLKMPGVGGLELTEAVRSRAPGTAVVWITAYGCYHVHDDSRRLGVFRCLDKPVSISRIRQVALEALGAETV